MYLHYLIVFELQRLDPTLINLSLLLYAVTISWLPLLLRASITVLTLCFLSSFQLIIDDCILHQTWFVSCCCLLLIGNSVWNPAPNGWPCDEEVSVPTVVPNPFLSENNSHIIKLFISNYSIGSTISFRNNWCMKQDSKIKVTVCSRF